MSNSWLIHRQKRSAASSITALVKLTHFFHPLNRLGLRAYERVRDRLLGMIRDNLERDNVLATISSASISKESEDSDDDEKQNISEAERNRLLIEKMSQGQPERKKSYSASKDTEKWQMAFNCLVAVARIDGLPITPSLICACTRLHFTSFSVLSTMNTMSHVTFHFRRFLVA